MKLTIGYLYGDLMNIYGDTGNIIALKKRAEWRGIEVEVRVKSQESRVRSGEIDLFFFGGGQDQAQSLVAKDLESSGKGKMIKQEIERGVPLLSICGGYQLLGKYYQPHTGANLPGVGLFQAYTIAGDKRMIGNIVISSELIANSRKQNKNSTNHELRTQNLLVGFENHSGKTYLEEGALPLGMVKTGFGNNGQDETEGCIYKNAIGSYMHGSLLPKNPELTDWLIKTALEVKYGKNIELKPLDNSLENQAHATTVKRFS